MSLKIPAGTDNGKRIVISGQGDAGENGGPAGDLVIVIHVENHQYFERDGYDLYCAVPISMSQAVLGCEVTVTGLDGKKIDIKVPEGTQHGKLLRVKNEGVPYTNSSKKGDLYIQVQVEVPTKLNSKQKELLKQFMEIENPKKEPGLISLSKLNQR